MNNGRILYNIVLICSFCMNNVNFRRKPLVYARVRVNFKDDTQQNLVIIFRKKKSNDYNNNRKKNNIVQKYYHK